MKVTHRRRAGLTLAEALVSVVIAAMVLTAVLAIYGQFQRSASAVIARVERPHLPAEILQRIADDVERLVDSQHEVKVTVENRFDNGYPVARLVLEKSYVDRTPEEPPLEEIVWQGNVDVGSDRIVLYRMHSGLMMEDKLLDPKRKAVEASYPYIPLAGGLTAFSIRVPQGVNWLDRWQGPTLPTGIEVTIAQAIPQKTARGTWEVAEKDRFVRTIAMDRTRILQFDVEDIPAGTEGTEGREPNSVPSTLPGEPDPAEALKRMTKPAPSNRPDRSRGGGETGRTR